MLQRPMLKAILLSILVASAVVTFWLPAPVADAGGCTACVGPERTATASALASTCAAARQAAESQAIANAFGGGLSCVPCQGQMTSYCADYLQCQAGQGCQWTAFATYRYKCKTCGPF